MPLSDSFDARYVKPPGGSMQKYTFAGRISQVGLEDFRVVAPMRTAAQANDPTGHGGSQFVEMTATTDSWVRRLAGHNIVEGIHIESGRSPHHHRGHAPSPTIPPTTSPPRRRSTSTSAPGRC